MKKSPKKAPIIVYRGLKAFLDSNGVLLWTSISAKVRQRKVRTCLRMNLYKR